MDVVPTLNFGGNCREALQMYGKAFNGKISCLITYGEANDPKYNPLLKWLAIFSANWSCCFL